MTEISATDKPVDRQAPGLRYFRPSYVLRSRVSHGLLVCFAALSLVHCVLLATGSAAAYPTKLFLMPALYAVLIGLVWQYRLWPQYKVPLIWIYAALGSSWLGDGAAFFFVGLPELPMMLICFGIAHLSYVVLIWRTAGVASPGLPRWAWSYSAVYLVLILLLWPHAGVLQVPVALYGLLLVATAMMTARCGTMVAWGGALFLFSDAVLSVRIFLPEMLPVWSDVVVMSAYAAGQVLIVWGLLRRLNARETV